MAIVDWPAGGYRSRDIWWAEEARLLASESEHELLRMKRNFMWQRQCEAELARRARLGDDMCVHEKGNTMQKLPPIDMTAVNPGVRRLVTLLREEGFDTCDSGDGATHDHECDRPYPYVTMLSPSDVMPFEARRLRALLEKHGVSVQCIGFDETSPSIQGTYDPVNDIATIDLTGVTDADLKGESNA